MTHLETTLSAIASIDSVLGMHRTALMNATDPVEQAKVRGLIDTVLDQRIELMKQRDELTMVAPPKKTRRAKPTC